MTTRAMAMLNDYVLVGGNTMVSAHALAHCHHARAHTHPQTHKRARVPSDLLQS